MKPLLLIFALFCQFAVYAQVLRPDVTAAAGTTQVATTGNAILSFTVGETAITTQNQPGISYGQGFHNGVAGSTVAIADLDLDAWQLRIFPSPASHTLFIHFTPPVEGAQLLASLWNPLGQCISKPVMLEKQEQQTFDVGSLPPGIYMLQLSDLSGRSRSIPFVKI
ncbi:MAG: T9SS type A sorting domain-containing protein [Phycisphaerae bacterium]|nr:T9SS type A sorting domain-containing protein [Saprospiraceae bacterium]